MMWRTKNNFVHRFWKQRETKIVVSGVERIGRKYDTVQIYRHENDLEQVVDSKIRFEKRDMMTYWQETRMQAWTVR